MNTLSPGRISLIARTAYLDPLRLPADLDPGLESHRAYDPPSLTFSNPTHLCEVEVVTETGTVRILRYVIAEDCGTVLNDMIVEGQQHGATALGIAGALYEALDYDAEGQLRNGTLADYLVPMAGEMPDIVVAHLVTPTATSELGAKGVGEAGTAGAPDSRFAGSTVTDEKSSRPAEGGAAFGGCAALVIGAKSGSRPSSNNDTDR